MDPQEMDTAKDEELIPLILSNQDHFIYVVKRYKEKLYRYIMRISDFSPEEAEDVLQDVFLKVYLNLNEFDTGLKFSSWIYRIAHNQVINEFRKKKARPQHNAIDLDDDMARQIASNLDIEKETDQIILKESIVRTLRELDAKYREVMVLRFLEEKSYEEISDIIKRPSGTVSSLLNQAKKEFKKVYLRDNKHKSYVG
mgnify:CR=1 FL=1